MANSYVMISSSGSLTGALKLTVKYGTWRRSKPADDEFIGLDGDTNISIGAASGKTLWQFTAYVKVTPDAGYVSLDQLEAYLKSQTLASRMNFFQDVYGNGHAAKSSGVWDPVPTAGDTFGANELYEVPVRVREA